MKFIISCLAFLMCVLSAQAQKEDHVWAYGNASGLDFNGGPVSYKTTSVENYHHYLGAGSASISDKDGNLLFYTNGTKIWDKSGAIMSGGILLSGYPMGPVSDDYSIWLTQQSAAIAPDPFDKNVYYVFHLWRNRETGSDDWSDTCSLFYNVVDMSLNNGKGAVVAGKKKILLDNQVTGALTVTRGNDCNVWVISHSIAGNAFKVYELSVTGLNTTPVVSNTGIAAYPPYYYDNNPYLHSPARNAVKVSPDRTKLAHCGNQGLDAYGNSGPSFLELFDFNANTGQIQNPLQLVNVPENMYAMMDVCFSPGSSKLYAVKSYPCMSCGLVAQYDLSLGTPAAILASQTIVNGGAPIGYSIRNAPDGRVYIAKSYGSLWSYAPAAEGLFYIQQPELPGTACQFVSNNMLFESFDDRGGSFPNNVVALPRDTLTSTQLITVCGPDTLWLQADTPSSNHRWWDNTTATGKAITESGTYSLQYQKGCTDRFDTFVVRFQPLPLIAWDSFTCNDPRMGTAIAIAQDSTMVTYTWKDTQGTLAERTGNKGDTLRHLGPGSYAVRVVTGGCDTSISFTINAYPQPELVVIPAYAKIRYGDSIQLQASGAGWYAWWPSGTVSNDTIPDPFVRPLQPIVYTVMGLNEFGCRDSATVHIDIDYQMPVFIPNAFSPNGDGINDVFRLDHITYQKLAAFRIFDRWGQQLFETGDISKGWDGMQGGKACGTGTYYYLVVINFPDGATRTYKGDLTLIR